MAAPKLKQLEVYVKQFCYKCVQIIVQSRSGDTLNTACIPSSSPGTWFNLSVGDDHKAQNSASAILTEKVLNFEQSLLVDISLQNENEFLLLETWSIEMSKYEGASTKNQSTYYNNLSQLLKSLTCMSRMTPAYNISRSAGQGYKIGYRIYRSKLDLQNLGFGSVKLQIGSVDTPLATVKLSVYHRSKESLHISTQSLNDRISFQHFSSVGQSSSSAARPCFTLLTSRVRTLSQTSDFESRLTDTPPSVILYSSSGEQRRSSPYGYRVSGDMYSKSQNKIEGNQKMLFGEGGSVKFVLGTPPPGGRCSTSPKSCSQKQSQNYCNQVGSSPVSPYSREAYGSPQSMGGIGEESWVINSTGNNKSQFYFLKDSDYRKKVVRVTSGFNTSKRPEDSPVTNADSGNQFVLGAFVGSSSPAEKANKILNGCRTDKDSGQDWLQRVNVQKKSLQPSNSPSAAGDNEQECSSVQTTRKQRRRNSQVEPALHKRDLAFANDENPSDKLSFYQSTKDLMNECCFRNESSTTGGQENFSQIAQELREYKEDAKEFDKFLEKALRR